MKKIAYIELDTHAEIAGNFLELMNNSKEFKVDFYFSQRILSQLNLKEDQNIFRSSANDILNQLSNSEYDLIIIGTAHRNFNVYLKIVEKFNCAVICHNLNFMKISKWTLFQNIFKKDFKYRLKLLFKEGLLSAPKVFKKANHLLVLDESFNQNKFKFLPVFHYLHYRKVESNVIRIVIPGSVQQHRRDYKSILKTLKSFKSDKNLKIYFLGKTENPELKWLQDFDKIKSSNISTKYYTEKVPQVDFDEVMQNADILWCPVQQETEFFSQKEIYGKTKMSGNIGDAIKYGNPAIFPKDYNSNFAFIINEEKHVDAQLENLAENFSFDFKENFKKEKVQKELEVALQDLIKI